MEKQKRIWYNGTSFGYCEGADIVSNGSLDGTLVSIGAVVGISGIIIAYLKYTRKDMFISLYRAKQTSNAENKRFISRKIPHIPKTERSG